MENGPLKESVRLVFDAFRGYFDKKVEALDVLINKFLSDSSVTSSKNGC